MPARDTASPPRPEPAAEPHASPAPDSAIAPAPEVTKQAVRLFGDSIVSVATTDSAVSPAAVEGPTWDIDVRSFETRSRVAYFTNIFTGNARQHFATWLSRERRYGPMIRGKLRAANLPEDMEYLALIESGYDPHAYSSAAAVGMWQLMTSTARDVGIRVDWWVDQRRDPVRSTDAAIRFLRWLNEQFGSLYLAAAAYDGGPGRIARGLSRYADDLAGISKDAAFFTLAEKDYLRAETKDYVPKLIAAALVAKQPERYGLIVAPLPPYEYDTVRVGPATPLGAIARASGSSLSVIRDLNPMILRGVTPPRDSFTVRVPKGKGAAFADSLKAVPEDERRAFRKSTTRKRDTMASLAERAGLSAHQLSWYNPGLRSTKRGRVTPGQSVLIPSAAVVAAALDVPDPSIEHYGSHARVVTHVVRKGETLGGLAKRFHTSVATLKRLNGLKKTTIHAGQELVVKRSAAKKHRKKRKR
ncbi:MAG: transglycosylase SLT domain-containing protein [Gemmatimonadota bacterium]|nr:transglycosylase SLT domain-containing protein [Gemmatimonadota bacterium]